MSSQDKLAEKKQPNVNNLRAKDIIVAPLLTSRFYDLSVFKTIIIINCNAVGLVAFNELSYH